MTVIHAAHKFQGTESKLPTFGDATHNCVTAAPDTPPAAFTWHIRNPKTGKCAPLLVHKFVNQRDWWKYFKTMVGL